MTFEKFKKTFTRFFFRFDIAYLTSYGRSVERGKRRLFYQKEEKNTIFIFYFDCLLTINGLVTRRLLHKILKYII